MTNGKSFDYVIIGAGSAGCTLANRLTEDPDVKVLVIDELAKGRNTDWELTILDHFISTRYNDDDKVTIVTTNFKDKLDNETGQEDYKKGGLSSASTRYNLEEKIGPRIFSRLMEMCKKVYLQGKDFRKV